MSNGYINLSRQSGLMAEMRTVANNIANLSTTGFRREGVICSEYLQQGAGGSESVSIATAHGRHVDLTQGPLEPTGNSFDLAIEGDGFFSIQTANGERLTRAGNFLPSSNGDLVTPDGNQVLDAGGSPIFIPPDAGNIAVSNDGTISADGTPLGRIGINQPAEGALLSRESGTLFAVDGDIQPVDGAKVIQGFVESANVNPVLEIARMIEVQRAYELGQSFQEQESKRSSNVIDTLTR